MMDAKNNNKNSHKKSRPITITTCAAVVLCNSTICPNDIDNGNTHKCSNNILPPRIGIVPPCRRGISKTAMMMIRSTTTTTQKRRAVNEPEPCCDQIVKEVGFVQKMYNARTHRDVSTAVVSPLSYLSFLSFHLPTNQPNQAILQPQCHYPILRMYEKAKANQEASELSPLLPVPNLFDNAS